MRLLRFVVALWLCLLAAPALASQATLVTPSAPLSMSGLASFLNSALLSVGSCNSGNSAPANGTGGAAFAGECWINTTSNPWVFSYTPDGTHWVEFGTLNTSSFVWTPYSNGFSASLGGNFITAGAFTISGAFAATLTFSGVTNASFPSGTHTLAGLDVNQTFSGNNTFSGTNNFTSTFQVNGNPMTFPGVAATLAYLAGNQTFSGNNTFNGTSALSGGGSFTGTFSGTPTFSGNLTFSGDPLFTGLSVGTCTNGMGVNSSNQAILVACPGSASSIQNGATTITSGGGGNKFLVDNGTLAEIANPLPTSNGGTGLTSPATHNIQVGEGSSPYNGIAPGSLGQFVGSAGASADPVMTSGPWTLLATLTASSSTSLSDITHFTATYTRYWLRFRRLVPSAAAAGILTFTVSGTPVITGYVGQTSVPNTSAIANDTPTSYISVGHAGSVINSSPGLSGDFFFSAPNAQQEWNGTGMYTFTGPGAAWFISGGFLNSASTPNGWQFCFGSSPPTCTTNGITSGSIEILGAL